MLSNRPVELDMFSNCSNSPTIPSENLSSGIRLTGRGIGLALDINFIDPVLSLLSVGESLLSVSDSLLSVSDSLLSVSDSLLSAGNGDVDFRDCLEGIGAGLKALILFLA